MRYFSIEFEWHSRPMYRKGRVRSCVLTFGAEDQTQAYELAKAEGERRFSRHKWKVIGCTELTVPERFKEAHERQSDSHDGSAGARDAEGAEADRGVVEAGRHTDALESGHGPGDCDGL